MLTIIIKNNGEKKVVELTYENIWREIKDIPDVELVVAESWFETIENIKDTYVCLLEADCLVNSGYFSSQLGLFKKNPMFRKLAMLSSAFAVNNWNNKFYGFGFGGVWSYPDHDGIQTFNKKTIPIREKKSRAVYPVQVGYVPGAIIRTSMLKAALITTQALPSWENDLVFLSTQLSVAFWNQGDGNPVHINPNTTYVTTEDYVNDIGEFETELGPLAAMFKKESI